MPHIDVCKITIIYIKSIVTIVIWENGLKLMKSYWKDSVFPKF